VRYPHVARAITSSSARRTAGNSWYIATHKEDVAPQELQTRAEAFIKQQKSRAA